MRYKVIGNHNVGGVDPGRTVELDEDDPRTAALVRAGHLAAQPAKKAKAVGETGPELVGLPEGSTIEKGDG